MHAIDENLEEVVKQIDPVDKEPGRLNHELKKSGNRNYRRQN
jgi:hypothetical protein